MSALLQWLLAHQLVVVAANLAAGCYALLAFLPELDLAKALRSTSIRLLVLVALAALGVPLLAALTIADVLHRRGLYYPPAGRGR
jgi:hypothetical protein